MLPVSCSAVTRRDSAIRCVREARARQAHLLETHASSRTVRQVVRRPALALTWQPAFVAPPRRAGAVLGASTRRAGARGTVLSGGRKKPASCVAALGVTVSFGPVPNCSGGAGGRWSPGRPRSFSLQTRAAGREHGGVGGGAARGTLRARRPAANEPLSLPHAGRLRGSRDARLRHAARCATRARKLWCGAARVRCARCSAVAVQAAQGTRAWGVSSGCAAAARGAWSGALHAARCDAKAFTVVTRRITVRDRLLGCAARLRAGSAHWRRLLRLRAIAHWLAPRCRSALLNAIHSAVRCAGRAARPRRSSGAHAALARPWPRGCDEN
jgi:hypothetical protein